MKKLITLIVTTVMTFLSSTLFANEMEGPVKFAKVETIVDHYIDATLRGNIELVDHMFTNDFYYSTPNSRSSENIKKKAMIKYLKSLKNVKMECESDYKFIEKNEDCSIVQITTTFENFTRNDYVTLCNSKDGWKISNVVVTYPIK
ncbi:nuclear transport factor 2 family protein [Sphingobacterium sp. 1.A.4]|uniref:nuclear transport factor 2 family protein n=1 Tax=Sphingobacterium sp. 1.A.4 TaxID=2044603 RepID=UPI000C0BB9CC|nr:nuclear transport factor 2 family protein [Sphingobacterium sp. 1.A.4]